MQTSIAVLAALALVGGAGFAFASSPRTYSGDDFALRVDASGAIHREPYQVARVSIARAELPASPVVDVPPVAPPSASAPLIESETDTDTAQPSAPPAPAPVGDECDLPAGAVSPSEKAELFPNRDGRFSKVPKSMEPMFEKACRDYGVPVRFLAAGASYETHFTPKLGDRGTSCGVFQFRDVKRRWTNWGFAGLEECMKPEPNIRKAAENWAKHMKKLPIRTVIRKHNGAGAKANAYAAKVMWGADTYYR